MARWEREGWTAFEGQQIPWSFYRDAVSKDAIGASAQVRCPLLVVHGDGDDIVPVEQAKAIHAAARGPRRLVIIPGGGHRFDQPGELEWMLREVSGWFAEHLI
jgi:dipeptidyl aminopeptidase/acylaminoacyl peptidase